MKHRAAFTLFELILAFALSATLLALVGTAVNLYLVRMDVGSLRVEEAQLARSILSTIAADIRATTTYQTQDISAASQVAAAAKSYNADDIFSSGQFSDSALQNAAITSQSTSSGTSAAASPTSATSDSQSATASTTAVAGLNGLTNELMLDVARLPRLDELFPPIAQNSASTAVTATAVQRPSDLKTVRYFVRPGTVVDPSDLAATQLSPQTQQAAGGLVRQSLDRATRQVAEQSGDAQLLSAGQVLLAPEVTQVQFVYFDGSAAVDVWDMQERQTMPTAVEIRIWLAPDPIDAVNSTTPLAPRLYRQTVDLPLAAAAAAASAGTGSETEESTTEDSSTTDSSSTGDDTSSSGDTQGFGV